MTENNHSKEDEESEENVRLKTEMAWLYSRGNDAKRDGPLWN